MHLFRLKNIRISSQCPKTLINYAFLFTKSSQFSIIVGLSVKSVLKIRRFHSHIIVEICEKLQTIAIAYPESLYLSLFDKLLEYTPNLKSLLKCRHRTVQYQRVEIRCFEVFERYFQRCPHLNFEIIFWVIGNLVGILTIQRSKLSLYKKLFSGYS